MIAANRIAAGIVARSNSSQSQLKLELAVVAQSVTQSERFRIFLDQITFVLENRSVREYLAKVLVLLSLYHGQTNNHQEIKKLKTLLMSKLNKCRTAYGCNLQKSGSTFH